MRFADMTLQKLPIPEKGQKMYSDASLPGFAVRVSQGGTKTFLAIVGKERRFVTIGRYPVVTLAQARDKARTILAEHQLGIVHKPSPLFRDVQREYLARRDGEVRGSTRLADTYLFQLFENLEQHKLAEITPNDVEAAIDRASAPSTKRSAYIRLSGLFSYAIRKGYIDRSPVKAIEIPPDQEPRHRVLTDDELRKILVAARMRRLAGDQYGAILELLIYTLQRRQQIASLTCHHVDRVNRTITWNHDEMKAKKRHTIPLTEHVETILDHFEPNSRGFYFGSRIGTPFCGFPYHFRKLTAEIGFSDFVLHDFRRVGATGMQRLRVGIETTEKLLAHRAVTGGLVGVYQRHAYLDEMRDALSRWEKHLQALLS